MAETISEPVYGVCLTCTINFSLGAVAVKKNLVFLLNLIFTSSDVQVFLLITLYNLEQPKPALLPSYLMAHCRYCLAKKPSLCYSELSR